MSRSVPAELIPPDEEQRVTAVHDLRLLDTRREERFDALVADLAKRLGVPIAYLALIAEDRQWIKSKVGDIPTEARREHAFCSRTILTDEPVLVTDATEDPRFSGSPLVQDHPHLRFYAGIPISGPGGHNVGTVCVAGPESREIKPRDLAILRGFAARLEKELNTRPTVMLAYALEDEELISRFIASHAQLQDPAVLDLWSSRRVDGNDWKLKDALWRANAVVLMVSPAFLRSPFVTDPALEMLLAAREQDAFTVTPVLLEPCDRSGIEWLAQRTPWPADDQAIATGPREEVDRRFRDLAIGLFGEPPEAAAADPRPEKSATRLFLSHAGEDAAAVKDLAARLRQAGVGVWLDVDELRPGDDWMQALEDALAGSDAFAVYIGRSGIGRWIGREVRVALDRNAKDPRFRFIPILGPGADPETLPRFVAQHHWLDLRQGEPQPEEVRKLVASILSRPAEAVSLLPPGEPPFRGLLTFRAEHAHLFFGRDRETAELLEKLRSSPFLAVIGDSGSGKSSLVRAGLVPALHRGHFRDATSKSATWRVAVIKPGGEPFRALAGGLLDLLPETGPAERMKTLEACTDLLAEGTRGLCSALAAMTSEGERTLLVIDQFEEVFTQSGDPDERDRFIDTLLAASSCDGERPLHTVVTLRADFYSHCFEHPDLPRVLSTSQYAVRAIAPDTLVEVIEKPASLAGITLEPGLAEAILFDLGDGPGNLPLLEHTLLQLWKRRTGDTLTHAAYEEMGRVQGALEHHAEEVYGSFSATERRAARQLLLGLVVPTESAGPARRRARLSEMLPPGDGREAAETVLARLVDERLVMVRASSVAADAGEAEGERSPESSDGGSQPEPRQDDGEVEVTHEALLRGWRRLGSWLAEDREFLIWRQRVDAAFEAWRGADRDSGALLRGAPLAEAQCWLETRGEDLSEEGRTFILASVALLRRQRWMRRAVMTTIAIVGAVALVLAWFFRQAQHEAVQAQSEVERSLVTATQAVDEMLTRVGSEALREVPQLEGVRQDLLKRAKSHYEELIERRPRASELRLQSALAPARIAEIDSQMGHREAALRGLESAIAKLEALADEMPDDPDYRFELAQVHDAMGWQLTEWMEPGSPARFSDALRHYDEAIGILGKLVEADPDNASYSCLLASSHLNRGILRHRRARLAEGRSDHEAAMQDYRSAWARAEPFTRQPGEQNATARQLLARSHNQLANLFTEGGQNVEAAEEYRRAAGLFESLVEEHPGNRDYLKELGTAYSNLALHEYRRGDPQEAVGYGRLAVDRFDDLVAALPDLRSGWATAQQRLGLALSKADQRDEAVARLREASLVFAELLDDHPQRQDDRYSEAVTLIYLGTLRADPQETQEIFARLEEILPGLEPGDAARIRRSPRFRRIQAQP